MAVVLRNCRWASVRASDGDYVLGKSDCLFSTLLVIDQPHRLTPRYQHQRHLLSRAPILQRTLRHPQLQTR
jgi:hypothetical protein